MRKPISNPPEELAKMGSAPGSLDEALAALKEDHDYLLKGDVFTQQAAGLSIRSGKGIIFSSDEFPFFNPQDCFYLSCLKLDK